MPLLSYPLGVEGCEGGGAQRERERAERGRERDRREKRGRGQSTHVIRCIQIVTKCLNAHETGARAWSVPRRLRHVRSAARLLSNSCVSMSKRHPQFDKSPNVRLSIKQENGRAL